MNVIYLDASAWVKRYYQELGTAWIQRLFGEGSLLACADLGAIEVIATLSRKAKSGQIGQPQFQQKQLEVVADWEQFIQIQLSEEVVKVALSLTIDLALRGADAVHLASAQVLQKSLFPSDTVIFVASDLELLAAAETIGIEVRDPAHLEE